MCSKTKALISFPVTTKLICVFVFAYAKCWFSHNAAKVILSILSHSGSLIENLMILSKRK